MPPPPLGGSPRLPTWALLLPTLLGGCEAPPTPPGPADDHPPGWTLQDEALQTFGSGTQDPFRPPVLDPEVRIMLSLAADGTTSTSELVGAAAARFGLRPELDSLVAAARLRFDPPHDSLPWGVLELVLWANGCHAHAAGETWEHPADRLACRHACEADACLHEGGTPPVAAILALRHPDQGAPILATLCPVNGAPDRPRSRREVDLFPSHGLLLLVDAPERLTLARWVVEVMDTSSVVELRVVRHPLSATLEANAARMGVRVFVAGPGGDAPPAPGETAACLYLAGPPAALEALAPDEPNDTANSLAPRPCETCGEPRGDASPCPRCAIR